MKFFVFVLGLYMGWDCSGDAVAMKCKKFSKFYVGKEVFECTKIEPKQ